MIPVISVENMRKSDAETIASGVDSKLLMYRAAFGIFQSIEWRGNIVIAVGSGNNGGDGFALSCILKKYGINAKIVSVGRHRTEDATFYEEIAKGIGVEICTYVSNREQFSDADIIVDCLLGTGFKGNVRSPYSEAIDEINRSDAYILSADINSGMNGDTGDAEKCIYPDHIATIGFIKRGLLVGNALQIVSKITCIDIGIKLSEEEWTLQISGDKQTGINEIVCPEGVEICFIDVSKMKYDL